jgi:hypothetical protein
LLVTNLSSFALDFAARFKIGGTHLNFFIINQLPILAPPIYLQTTPWSPGRVLHNWLLPRVLELTYTAWDLAPFARDCGYNGLPFGWDDERRFRIRCELDAAYFHFYGITRDDVDYILETFPIVKRKDEAQFGEFRTKRMILDIYDAMAIAIHQGSAYPTRLDPPPGQR